jgi:hypothetical protein
MTYEDDLKARAQLMLLIRTAVRLARETHQPVDTLLRQVLDAAGLSGYTVSVDEDETISVKRSGRRQ